ncbi:beta-ketoacyl synthase N-terminal-like domain-containing protein, partial [Pantoea eucalypti]
MSHSSSSQRIVITGAGVVSPLGCGVNNVWQQLTAGESGIRTLPDTLTA